MGERRREGKYSKAEGDTEARETVDAHGERLLGMGGAKWINVGYELLFVSRDCSFLLRAI